MSNDKASIRITGKRLRAARRKNHFTQVEIAKKAGISETYYAEIERGEKNPTISVFSEIIDAIGVNSKDILGK